MPPPIDGPGAHPLNRWADSARAHNPREFATSIASAPQLSRSLLLPGVDASAIVGKETRERGKRGTEQLEITYALPVGTTRIGWSVLPEQIEPNWMIAARRGLKSRKKRNGRNKRPGIVDGVLEKWWMQLRIIHYSHPPAVPPVPPVTDNPALAARPNYRRERQQRR